MQYRQFGRTGLSVSSVCLGTGQFGKQIAEHDAFDILGAANDAGINFIDTADMYPAGATEEERGSAERIVGRWLKDKRSRFILGTKAGDRMGSAAWDRGNSRKHLLDAIDASLNRLNTDYIDLYQLHLDDAATPIDETLEAFDIIVRSGRARYIGVSNFLAYRLARAVGRQDVLRLARFVSVQPRYNLLFREVERQLLPLSREEGFAVIPYNPLAGGLLSGKYKLQGSPTKGRFSTQVGRFGAIYQARYWHEREFATVGRISEVAKMSGAALPTIAVAWLLANPAVTSVILGATRVEQLKDTLAGAEWSMADEMKASLDEISIDYRKGDAEI